MNLLIKNNWGLIERLSYVMAKHITRKFDVR